MQAAGLGTIPQVWLLLNEINTNVNPFLQLFNPVNDPPEVVTGSMFVKRWYTENTLSPFPNGTKLINLASIKIVFSSTDTVKNEVYGVFLRDNI